MEEKPTTPPIQQRQDALQAVLGAIATMDPRSQRRILESAAVFLNVPLYVRPQEFEPDWSEG